MINKLNQLINPKNIRHSTRYHKEHYLPNEVDTFVGIDLADIKIMVKELSNSISHHDFDFLMTHDYHEFRMIAISILVERSKTESINQLFDIYNRYINYINNWDLVDVSAPAIVGRYVDETGQRQVIDSYIKSDYMWTNRVATVACLYLIKKGEIEYPLEVIQAQLIHNHDLMHKANGWMLREVGKISISRLNLFLKENYHKIPRTTLRYAIEKHQEDIRKKILGGDFSWL